MVDLEGLKKDRDLINSIDWEMTPEEAVRLYLEWGNNWSQGNVFIRSKDDISHYFEPGKEIETFKDEDEFIEKISYYIDHADQREVIARRGQERCLRDYAMTHRAQTLHEIVEKYLSSKHHANVLHVK